MPCRRASHRLRGLPHRSLDLPDTPASRAASAAWITILLATGGLLFLVWQATGAEAEVPVLMLLASLAMACCIVLHLVFVALLARRLGRPAGWTVAGAALTLPIGSLVGLILYEWHHSVDQPQARRST